MTARSRRHKFDKKRKSDEHPHPRRSEEADGSTESPRSRTGLIPRNREGQDAEHKGIVEAILEAKERYRLHSVYLVPEGQGFPGSYIKAGTFPTEDLYELNVIEPTEYSVLTGYPQGAKLYLNDYEKELLDTVQREFEEKLAGGKEVVRTSGSSDDATAS